MTDIETPPVDVVINKIAGRRMLGVKLDGSWDSPDTRDRVALMLGGVIARLNEGEATEDICSAAIGECVHALELLVKRGRLVRGTGDRWALGLGRR